MIHISYSLKSVSTSLQLIVNNLDFFICIRCSSISIVHISKDETILCIVRIITHCSHYKNNNKIKPRSTSVKKRQSGDEL